MIVGYGYETGIEKTDLKVLGEPRLWVKEKNDKGEDVMVAKGIQEGVPLLALPESGPLSMSYEVEVRPEFELPPIDNIPVTKRIITVTDKDIDQRMEQMRNMFARLESVPDGTVQTDDILMVDIRMVSEGTELKKQENVQLAARPQRIEGVKREKLGEALAGAKMEEVKTITGQLPDTYPKADFRGKPADFEIRIRQISRFIPASIEEAVKRGGFEKEEDMRDWIRSEQESQVAEYVQQDMSQQIIQYLLDKTNLDVPERLSEQQAAHVVTRRLVDLMQRGVPQAEVEKRADEMITSAKADVAREMKLAFIMAKLSDTCKVEVSDEEINAQIAMIARRQNKRFDRVRDDLNKRGAMDSLYIQLRDAKIIDELLRKATVTEEAAPAVVTGDDKGR